jgi:hypothetical protein
MVRRRQFYRRRVCFLTATKRGGKELVNAKVLFLSSLISFLFCFSLVSSIQAANVAALTASSGQLAPKNPSSYSASEVTYSPLCQNGVPYFGPGNEIIWFAGTQVCTINEITGKTQNFTTNVACCSGRQVEVDTTRDRIYELDVKQINVVSATTFKELTSYSFQKAPVAFALDRVTDSILLLNNSGSAGELTIINASSGANLFHTDFDEVSSAVGINTQSNLAYIAASGYILVFNLTSTSFVTSVFYGETFSQVAIDQNTNMIYLPSTSSGDIVIFNATSDKFVGKIETAFKNIALDPSLSLLYVENGTSSIEAISTISNKLVAQTSLQVSSLTRMAVNTGTNRIYVGGLYRSQLFTLNAKTLATLSDTWLYIAIGNIVVNPNTNLLYAAAQLGPKSEGIIPLYELLVISGSTNKIVANVSSNYDLMGPGSAQLAVDPTTDRIYLGEEELANGTFKNYQISVIDGSSNKYLAHITLPGDNSAFRLLMNPSKNTLFALGASSPSLYAINGATNGVVAQLKFGPCGCLILFNAAADPSTNMVYVTNGAEKGGFLELTAINAGYKEVENMTLSNAGFFSIDPRTDLLYLETSGTSIINLSNYHYVANYTRGAPYVIDPVTDIGYSFPTANAVGLINLAGYTSIQNFTVGFAPIYATVNTNANKAYFSTDNEAQSTIAIVSG